MRRLAGAATANVHTLARTNQHAHHHETKAERRTEWRKMRRTYDLGHFQQESCHVQMERNDCRLGLTAKRVVIRSRKHPVPGGMVDNRNEKLRYYRTLQIFELSTRQVWRLQCKEEGVKRGHSSIAAIEFVFEPTVTGHALKGRREWGARKAAGARGRKTYHAGSMKAQRAARPRRHRPRLQ